MHKHTSAHIHTYIYTREKQRCAPSIKKKAPQSTKANQNDALCHKATQMRLKRLKTALNKIKEHSSLNNHAPHTHTRIRIRYIYTHIYTRVILK